MKRFIFKIELTVIIGIGLSIFIIKYAIGTEYIMQLFWNPPSIALVLGGVIAATTIHFPNTQFRQIFSRLIVALSFKSKHKLIEDIDNLVDIATTVQANGMASIMPKIETCTDHFLKLGLTLLYDNVPTKELEILLKDTILYTKKRHLQGISFFHTMAQYSPAFGLFGTVIGLIKLLSDLGDPELFGQSMALAMVTTFYGLFFANFIFSPIAGRLQILSDEENIQKEMLVLGILCISKKERPYLIKEKMQTFLSKKDRKILWKK